MIFYLSTIFIAMIILILLNILFSTTSITNIIFMVTITTAFQFVIDGVFAFLVHSLPDKWFSVENKFFTYSKKRQKFYEKLQIKKWKDKVWELGALGGFRKNKVNEPNNPEYIKQFIIECNKGIIDHQIAYFVGFLGVFLFPLKYAFVIGIPIAIINLFLNILPTMILQYNQPKLKIVLKYLEKQKINQNKNIEKNYY